MGGARRIRMHKSELKVFLGGKKEIADLNLISKIECSTYLSQKKIEKY